MNFLLLL